VLAGISSVSGSTAGSQVKTARDYCKKNPAMGRVSVFCCG